jgi:hypothetical protein
MLLVCMPHRSRFQHGLIYGMLAGRVQGRYALLWPVGRRIRDRKGRSSPPSSGNAVATVVLGLKHVTELGGCPFYICGKRGSDKVESSAGEACGVKASSSYAAADSCIDAHLVCAVRKTYANWAGDGRAASTKMPKARDYVAIKVE